MERVNQNFMVLTPDLSGCLVRFWSCLPISQKRAEEKVKSPLILMESKLLPALMFDS